MSSPRVRPTFDRPLSVDPQRFFARLREALSAQQGHCSGQVFDGGAIMRLRSDERKIWSPALHVTAEPAESAGSSSEGGALQLHGRFSPSSPVWTGFIAIYLALTCIAVASACYGYAQYVTEAEPWALIGVPVALLLAGLTYGTAFIGQGLGAEDMYVLRSFVEQVADQVDPPPHYSA